MHIHQKSNIAFIKYQPEKTELYFNHQGLTMKTCLWEPNEFYLAASCNLIESDSRFKSESLRSLGEKLESTKFLDRALLIQATSDESYVDVHMFNMHMDESEAYLFEDLSIDFHLNEKHIKKIIDAINKGLWHDIKFTIFINESSLINDLLWSENNNFVNYQFAGCDFSIEI